MNIAERIREKRKAAGLTQTQVADYFHISSVSVSEWERGLSRPDQTRLAALARLLKTSISYLLTGKDSDVEHILPRSLGGATSMDNLVVMSAEENAATYKVLGKSSVTALDPEDPIPDNMVYVPESRIEFAAGNGRVAHFGLVEDQEPATYRLSWFQKYGINPDRVRRFRVAGDSMEPLLFARDTILVNLDETSIMDGKLYAIRYGDELRVKYLRRLLDGTLILHSVNPLYEDEKIPPELAAEHISVIGRVRDRSGTGGL